MSSVRALVVDDEKPGRERLRRLLTKERRVELAGCCAGGAEAVAVIRDADSAGSPIQILFLDVQMPEMDGFGVISALVRQSACEQLPAVVFVTAHDEYALRAFDAHAIDYLLKPFSDERFQAALDRAIRHVRAGHAHALMSQMQALLGAVDHEQLVDDAALSGRTKPAMDRVVLKGPNRVRLLPVDQIAWIEAEGVYVKLHTRDGAVHLHRGLLGSFDSALDERAFVRIHRSAIVNIDVVEELRQDAHGDYIAVLRDRTEVRVGRRFRARLQARLGQAL
jgi:two-component system, LytTR family, response regulator